MISLTEMCIKLGKQGFSAKGIAQYARDRGIYCTPPMVYYRWEKGAARAYRDIASEEAELTIRRMKLPKAKIQNDSPEWVQRRHANVTSKKKSAA